jgi:predicted dehydrogenase
MVEVCMSEPLHRVLIVGAGSIGERHLRCFLATGRAKAGLVEINPELRESIGRRYSVEETYADLDRAIADRWDAAVIATPAPLHVPMARRMVEAGAHVLIEKPLSVELAGVAELDQAVRDHRVTAAVAYVYRAAPPLTAMREAIQQGRFGRPLQVVATSGQNFPTYRPAYADTYYARRESGGGAVQDALTHVLNAGEWLVGPVTRVLADAAHLALPGVSVEDTVHVLARHGDVLGCYSLNQHQAPNETSLTVICQEGTAQWQAHAGRWRWMAQPGGVWQDEPSPTLERDELFRRQADAFLDAIEGRRPPLCTLDEGVQTLRVNRGILASLDVPGWQQTTAANIPVDVGCTAK